MRAVRFATDQEEHLIRTAPRLCAPSKAPDPWLGHWIGDERFTREQQRACAARGIDAETVEAFKVHVVASGRQIWVPDDRMPMRRVPCPLLQRRTDGRVQVVAPSGDIKLVYADGAVSKQGQRRLSKLSRTGAA